MSATLLFLVYKQIKESNPLAIKKLAKGESLGTKQLESTFCFCIKQSC